MAYQQYAYEPTAAPPTDTPLSDFGSVRERVAKLTAYVSSQHAYNVQYQQQLQANHNSNGQGFGPDLVAANIIEPRGGGSIYVITGTAPIQTIRVPKGFNGPLYLIARDGFSTITGGGGNIAQAVTVPATSMLVLCYAPQTQLFYVIAVTAVIAPGSITTTELANGAVTTAKLGAKAASASGSVVDNTVQAIGTTDTSIASFTIPVNATSDFVQIHGRTISNITNYASGGTPPNVTLKLWRGAVGPGTVVDQAVANLTTSTSANLSGEGVAAYAFFDTGVSGTVTYSISMACDSGPTLQKTSCVTYAIDQRAQ